MTDMAGSILSLPPCDGVSPRGKGLGKLLLCLVVAFLWNSPSGLAASIYGTVKGPRGILPNAQVTLLQGDQELQVLSTDSQGQFSLENLSPGAYRLQVVLSPYLPVVKEITVTSEVPGAEVTIELGTLSESVTVTAGRVPVPVATAVSNVKIVTGEDLRQMPYQALDDRLRALPEFSLFRRSSSLVAHPTTQGVSLRGIGPSGVSRSLLLADGVPLNDAFGGWVYWDRIPLLSIQQVEVANGGTSDLYGNYGLGGVIQLLKKIPTPATLEFQGQGGSRGSLKGDLYASHRVGAYGFSLAGSVFDFDGYPLVVKRQRGTVDIPAFSRHQAVRFYAERAPAQSSSVWSLEGGFLNEHRGNGTPFQNNQTVSFDFATGAQWSPTLRDRLEWRAFFRRTIFSSNFSAVAANRNSERPTLQQHVPSADGGASLLWTATRERHRIVAGSDLWVVAGRTAEGVFTGTVPQVTRVRAGEGKQSTLGFFAEENYAISPKATLLLGGRVDLWKNFDGANGSFPIAGPQLLQSAKSRTEAVFSPRAGFTYQATSQFSLYGSVFRSFRAPTLNELFREFRVGNVTTTANPKLTLERNFGVEVGGRFQPARSLRFTLAGFLNLLDDPVSNVTLRTTPTEVIRQRQNLGRARISGLEATAAWAPRRFFKVNFNYLFDRSRVIDFRADRRLEGNFLPQVPQHRWSVTPELSLPGSFQVALIGRFVGDQFDDDLNRVVLDRFFQMDAHLSRSLGETARLFLTLENLTDAKILFNRSPVDFVSTPFQIRGGIYFQLHRSP